MKKAIFIDKDGTLIKDVPYNVDPSHIHINHGVAEMLQRLRAHGYIVVVISNQSGIAHGYFTEQDVNDTFYCIKGMLRDDGASIDHFYYCPHHPEGQITKYAVDCHCRKPKPGLITRAANDLGVDLSVSWMVGDILNDVEAGNRAGCKTVLMDMGNETDWNIRGLRCPMLIAEKFDEVTELILSYPQMVIHE